MHEFLFQRDLKKVNWVATFKLNLFRASALGLIYLLKTRKPAWVPSLDFKIFNFAFMIFVVNDP